MFTILGALFGLYQVWHLMISYPRIMAGDEPVINMTKVEAKNDIRRP